MKTCKVCKHPIKNHKPLTLHKPDGMPYPTKISCNCVAGNIMLGDVLCGCDLKRSRGLEIIKSWGLKPEKGSHVIVGKCYN